MYMYTCSCAAIFSLPFIIPGMAVSCCQDTLVVSTGREIHIHCVWSKYFVHFGIVYLFIVRAFKGMLCWLMHKVTLCGVICVSCTVTIANFSQDEIGTPVMDTVLEAGDLLYFPRGTIHQVLCTWHAGCNYCQLWATGNVPARLSLSSRHPIYIPEEHMGWPFGKGEKYCSHLHINLLLWVWGAGLKRGLMVVCGWIPLEARFKILALCYVYIIVKRWLITAYICFKAGQDLVQPADTNM